MWANYYPKIVCVHHTRKSAGASNDPSYPHAVPVAVIPLNDPEALVHCAYEASRLPGEDGLTQMRAALTGIGVLPRQRKGGAK